MDKSRSARCNSQILEEASMWLVEFNEGEVGNPAREEFSRWLRTSPEHVRAYLQISALWEDAPDLVNPGSIDVEALIARARKDSHVVPIGAARIGKSPPTAERIEPARFSLRSRVVAATLLLAGTVAGLVWREEQRGVYATGTGEQRSVTLSDGSTIELNAQSRVRVRFAAGQRDVELLEGQALFDVTKNSSRPFVVSSGVAHVRAVGTRFDVLKGSSRTVVTVIEGRVAVSEGSGSSSPDEPAWHGELVSAGEQLAVLAQARADSPSPIETMPHRADVTAATAWRQRKLVFSSSPLTEVVLAYNRYHEKPLVILDQELADLHVSGVFSATDNGALLAFLRTQPNIVVHETSNSFEIANRK